MRYKKFLSVFLVAFTLVNQTAFAYKLPNAFWALAERYEKALANNDHNEIIAAGGGIVSLLENEEKNEQVNTIMASKLYDMGYSYEALGGIENHIKAGECFEKYIPYAQTLGWSDGIKIAEQKSMQFLPTINLYTPTTEPQCYFGAVSEPKKGVLFGQVSEHYQDNESMILLYLEYGQSTEFTWANHIFQKARESGKAVELALNFPYQGAQLDPIINDTQYITALVDFLKNYKDVPTFLRIGAEVNIWENTAQPELFKTAFRKIADAVKNMNSEIATVWSVMHTSNWNINMDDYYPGDEYVDWVGISAYANRYFLAQEWEVKESHNPIVFKAADAADPVLMIKEVVKRYGDRKPIMLAECGAAYYTKGQINQYSVPWAQTALKRMYSMVPIVYPQVKLIAYFNTKMTNENNYYDLESCTELKDAYNEITAMPWFIKNSFNNEAEYSYKLLENTINAQNSLELYAYPHVYGYDVPVVNYYINGTWVASTSQLPYHKVVDLSAYPSGSYTLTAEADCGGYSAVRKDYTLNINNSADELAGLNEYQLEALEFCKAKNVISGYEDGTVRPYNNITRAEFASMTARLFALECVRDCTFDDAASHWASRYIQACVEKGAISGVGDNKFAPDNNVTCEQAMKITTSVCGFTDGYNLEELGGYPDAYTFVGKENNLLSGFDNYAVGVPLTRINAAVLFYNAAK